MNGARGLLRTLVDAGVTTCFMNPGTSEMHFVAALDSVPEMRSVLALFEGVATGAADGYGRMAGHPAAVLLHLGPGLGNGLANLHNARRARTPVVNIVGDHATYHKRYDAQLDSDIETVARNVSTFIRRSTSTEEVRADAADTVAAALGPPGQVATLILPADVSWTEADMKPAGAVPPAVAADPEPDQVAAVVAALRSGQPAALLVGGRACRAAPLAAAGAIAGATGAKLLCETFPARLERGAGRVAVARLAYLAEFAAMQLDGLRHLVLVDARAPVSFFAYPGKASDLVPAGCQVHTLAGPTYDVVAALEAVREGLGGRDVPAAPTTPPGLGRQAVQAVQEGGGALTAESAAAVIGALLPDGAIVVDEANTSGLFLDAATAGAPPHDWLCLTGGAIGMGPPVAVGAAVACPGRRVVSLQADGSAMYTLQAWWTMAREGLDVTTVVFANRAYAVLNMELGRVGAQPGGPRAKDMLDLRRPDLDLVAVARGLGVPATRAETTTELADELGRSLATPGPSLIEAVLPALF